MALVHDEGRETPLPQVTSPPFPEIDMAGVLSMRLPNDLGKPFRGLGNRDEMYMVRHEAIRQDSECEFNALFTHQFNIDLVILLTEEYLLPAVAALNMARILLRNCNRSPWHRIPLV